MDKGFAYSETAKSLGFRDGDIPLRTETKTFKTFDANLFRDISEAHQVTVRRQGKEVAIALPGDLNLLEMLQGQPRFLDPLAPSLIDSVAAGGPAEQAGIRGGDVLVGFQGKTLTTWNEFNLEMGRIHDMVAAKEHLTADDSTKLRSVTAVVRHSGTTVNDTIALSLDSDFRLGIFMHNPLMDYPITKEEYGILECVPAGIAHGWDVLCGYVDDLKYIFTAEGAKSVGSFGTIGNLFPAQWDWLRFWELTAFISLMLAFMNILPIPALDGGHVFFLLVEVITRRKPSERFMEIAQTIGMWLLFALMAYAIFNDLLKFVF